MIDLNTLWEELGEMKWPVTPGKAQTSQVISLVQSVLNGLEPGEQISTSELMRRLHVPSYCATAVSKIIGACRRDNSWPGAVVALKSKTYGHPQFGWHKPAVEE